MIFEELAKQLKEHEGFRRNPYKCTEDRWTVGYGRNLSDKGITEEEAMCLLKNDINECYADLSPLFVQFELLSDSIQHVLLNMRFQLGARGFRSFEKMITAVNNHNQKEFVAEMRDSKWYRQVPNRAENLIKRIEE